jgi:hypothetical protein
VNRRFGTVVLAPVLALVCAVGAATPAVADPPPTVSIAKDKPIYVSGQTEHITVTVSGAGPGKILVVTAFLPNGTSKVVDQTGTSDNDTFHFTYTVYVNHTLRADVYDTDGTTLLASTPVLTVPEYAGLTTAPKSGYLGYSGAYLVYARGSKPVFRTYDQTGQVGGRCLRHVVQRHYSSGWRTKFTSACRAESNKRVDWKWLGKHPSRVKFRVRGYFAGDIWNRAHGAGWQYFKFR